MVMVMLMTLVVMMMFMIVMMLMLFVIVVMAAAGAALSMVMVMLMIVVVMMFMIVMMLMLFMVMVVMMLMITAMVMLFFYMRKVDLHSFDRVQDLLSTQIFHWCCDDRSIRIQFTDQFDGSFDFFRCCLLCIGTAQDDRAGCFYLILEEFTKVLQIHFAFQNIDNRNGTVQFHFSVCFQMQIFNCMDNVRKFADT